MSNTVVANIAGFGRRLHSTTRGFMKAPCVV